MILGELAALLAAGSYASSSNVFSIIIKKTTPLLINILRGVASTMLMFIILCLSSNSVLPDDSLRNYILLIISGVLGIGIGDSFYFNALHLLGARKTILLETMAPPFTGLISYFYYGTSISIWGWLGIFVTAYGIYIVVNEAEEAKTSRNSQDIISTNTELPLLASGQQVKSEKTQETTQQPQENSFSSLMKRIVKGCEKDFIGIMNGVAFTFCQSFGMVLSHDAANSQKTSSLQSSLIRITAGNISILIMILASKNEKFLWPWKERKDNFLFIAAVILGPFIGIWAQQTSLIYTRPEIAQTILATTPLFGLLISYFRGEQMRLKYLVGSVIAILGVCIIVWL